jgi:hypothetical protein
MICVGCEVTHSGNIRRGQEVNKVSRCQPISLFCVYILHLSIDETKKQNKKKKTNIPTQVCMPSDEQECEAKRCA